MKIAALALIASAALAATAAQAETQQALRPLDLSALRPSVTAAYAQQSALRAAGFARTSVGRRLSPDGAVAEAGFLCGRDPGPDKSGAVAAFGEDPHGRFVGAKVRLAF